MSLWLLDVFSSPVSMCHVRYCHHFTSRQCLHHHNPVLSSFMTYHLVCIKSDTTGTTSGTGSKLTPGFSGGHFARSLVFCVVFCRSICLSFFFFPSIYDFWLPLFFQFFSYNPLDQLKANVTLLVINILYEFCFIQKFNTTARPIMISDQLKFQKLFSETTCVLESLYGGKWPSMILSKLITWLHVNTTTIQYMGYGLKVMVFNATFNYISVLFVEETKYPKKPLTCCN